MIAVRRRLPRSSIAGALLPGLGSRRTGVKAE